MITFGLANMADVRQESKTYYDFITSSLSRSGTAVYRKAILLAVKRTKFFLAVHR